MTPLFLPAVLALSLPLAPLAGEQPAAGGPGASAEAARAVAEIVVHAGEAGGELVITIGQEGYTLETLGEFMRRQVSVSPNQLVRILGEPGMPWQRMADVISTCSKAGVWNLSFSMQMPDTPAQPAAQPVPQS